MSRQPIVIRDEAGRKRAIDLLAALNLAKPWEITVEPHKKKRTLSQNALYWAWLDEVVTAVARETGDDKDAIHQVFKEKFLKAKTVEALGVVTYEYSTKALTIAEMAEYMNRIYAWVTSELGILLPLPEAMHQRAA